MSQQTRKPTNRKNVEEPEISSMNILQQEIQNKMVNPEDSSYCNCNICQQKYQLKELGKTFLRQTNSSCKVQPHRMQEFFSLIASVNAKQYLKLDIPQICFFSKGEPRKLFRSNNMGVHQIQLTPTVKKNLINIFLENKKSNGVVKQKDITASTDITKDAQDSHIKFFDSVVPRVKHGDLKNEKKPKNFIFHNNSQMDEDPNRLLHKNTDEEICLIKYKQKNYELINEKQLRGILKSLLSLQNVEFIQSYLKPSDQEDQIFQASYDWFKRDQNPLMFSRSLVQVKIDVNLINKFSKDYITPEHLDKYETQVLKDIPQEYCMYQNYKIVHYMELMKDMKVEKLSTLWLMQSSGEICFFGLIEFQWRQNQKFSVDIGEIQELKELVSVELSDFETQLLNAWESMKSRKQMHLSKVETIDQQKQRQIEEIKKQSQMRFSKQLSMKKSRKKSFSESHPSKNRG